MKKLVARTYSSLVALLAVALLLTGLAIVKITHWNTAHTAAPNPSIGVFFGGNDPSSHSCTGAVISTASRNLVLTAAHCLPTNNKQTYTFSPGYSGGERPYGTWTVQKVFVLKRWATKGNTEADFALAQIAPQKINGVTENIGSVVEGLPLSPTPPTSGSFITAMGYNAGKNDDPIACTTKIVYSNGYPRFNCSGFVSGSSGSPWLQTNAKGQTSIVGVIGGYEQGGCSSDYSYSSPIDLLQKLLTDAESDKETVNQPHASTC